MNGVRKILAGGALIGLGVAACSGAAHMKPLQPPSPPVSPTVTSPPVQPPRPLMELGADVDMYTYPRQDIAAASSAVVAYAKSLHANSLPVSFPFFMHGQRAAGVYAARATPSPGEVATLAQAAERAGLYVSVRPLLDEGSLGRSRVGWKPAHMKAWFASYQKFLLPYAVMAQREHIPVLFVGAEFTAFGSSPRWVTLDRALRAVYHGRLAYANNGNKIHPHAGGDVGAVTVDAYPRMHGSGQGWLTRGWEAYDRALPHGTILTEVGIGAVAGAYAHPWAHHSTSQPLDLTVQARWFTAACHAAMAEHLGGIYFWGLGFSTQLSGPTDGDQGAWAHDPGAQAIQACFSGAGHG